MCLIQHVPASPADVVVAFSGVPNRYCSLDEGATHILLRLVPSLQPIGTIRCTKTEQYYKLSRLAVLKDFRKYRFGRALVQSLHDFAKADAKASGSRVSETIKVIAHSQIPVKGFYGK